MFAWKIHLLYNKIIDNKVWPCNLYFILPTWFSYRLDRASTEHTVFFTFHRFIIVIRARAPPNNNSTISNAGRSMINNNIHVFFETDFGGLQKCGKMVYTYWKRLSMAGLVKAGGRNERWFGDLFFRRSVLCFLSTNKVLCIHELLSPVNVFVSVCAVSIVACFITTAPIRTHAPIYYNIILYNIITCPIQIYGRTIGKRKRIRGCIHIYINRGESCKNK